MTTVKKKIVAEIREKKGKKGDGKIPAVLYGAKRKSTSLFLQKKEFDKLYEEAGESTLVTLDIKDQKDNPPVLIYDVQRSPVDGEIMHVDFFEPNLKEEVEAEIPIVFVGESLAVKELEGTLVKNFYSINVKALPENLPHEVKVDVGELKELDSVIYIKDINIPANVEILHDEEGVVASISRPENVEEELEKPIEEGEEPEVIGEKAEEEETEKEGGESDETNKEETENKEE